MNNYESGKYAHYNCFGFGFSWHQMMEDVVINVCADILVGKEPEDKASAAAAIQDGYVVRRNDGTLFVTAPAFTRRQKDEFNELTDRIFAPLIERYVKIVDKFAAGYKKLFPKHLPDVADRQCNGLFMQLLNALIVSAQDDGVLEIPSYGKVCEVLIENR